MKKVGIIFGKVILWTLGIILTLVLALFVLIQIPSVQQYALRKVTAYLETKIETPFHIGRIDLDLPKMLVLEDIYLEDREGDTLLAGERLRVDINMLRLLRNVVEVQQIDLIGITATVKRTLPQQTFNFAYIIDAFAGSETENEAQITKEEVSADSTSALIFDVDKVNLERIHIRYHDEVVGISTNMQLESLHTRLTTFDLEGAMHFAAPEININGLKGDILQWTSEIPADTTASGPLPLLDLGHIHLHDVAVTFKSESIGIDTRFAWENLNTKIDALDLNTLTAKIAQLSIEEGEIKYVDLQSPRMPTGFDYGNINVQQLMLSLSDFSFTSDTIQGNLKALSAKDHSGFQLTQLQTEFEYTNQSVTLANLLARTPKTRIQKHLEVHYPSLESLTERIDMLEIAADLRDSYLSMEDVRYFVPFIDTITAIKPILNEVIQVEGQIDGRLSNLLLRNIHLRVLDETLLHANARIQGLPEIDNLVMDLDLQTLASSRANLDQLIDPSLLPMELQFPEELLLSGNFKGGWNSFTTQLDFRSTDGNANLDGAFAVSKAMDGGPADTTFTAQLAIVDLQLGRILKQDSVLGALSFAAEVEGKGLDPKKLTANFKGDLISLELLGYNYQDLTIIAQAEEGIIELETGSDDRNIDFDLKAFLNLQPQYPKLQLNLMIDSINLKKMNLMEEEFRYRGLLTANLETADIDFLNGVVEVKNSSIAYNQERYTFNSIKLLAEATEGSNLLQLTSEFLTAHLVGNYKLSELDDAIKDIIAVYYQPDSIAPVYSYSPQQFDFSAKLSRSRFIRDFLPELTEMQDVTLDGSFISEEKFLLAKVLAPKITYGEMSIVEAGLDINTFDSTMYYSALIKEMVVSNIEMRNTLLSGTVLQNELDFGLWIKDKEDRERYHLGMKMAVDSRNFSLSLLENGLMLNYDQWEVHPDNRVTFGTNGILADNVELSYEGQRMRMQSQQDSSNAPIDLQFENFQIETFSNMLESDLLRLGGGMNGQATISRLDSKPLFVSNIGIDEFYFGKDTIGDVLINVHNQRENIFAAEVSITGRGNEVNLTGDFIAPPGQDPQLDFKLALKPLTMKSVEAFSLGYLRQTEGTVTGELTIKGTTAGPRINGDLLFNDAVMNVGMINATFTVDDQRVSFDQQGLRFNRFELRDRKNNIARLNGTINTSTYTDFSFNLTLTADDFQVLNSTKKDLDIFYGQLYASTNLRITGSINNPLINGSLQVDEDTNVTFVLPNDAPGMVEREGIIKFVDRSDTTQVNAFARLDSLTTTELGGLRLSMNIQTHPSAAFSIVIDEGSGDALNIKGSADLNAGIDPSGNITLTGTYTVDEGNYSFTFEPVKRVFDFKKGSTITWAGDPLDARLNITAVYKVKAPTLELVQSQVGGQQANLYKQRIPFDVNLGITGQMLKPDLNFWIDLDEDNSLVAQDVASKVNTALAQLKENESEMNKQVFSLIVLGKFMAANPFESVSGGSVGSMARNSVSSLLSAQLNRLAGDLIKGVDVDFDLQSGDDYSTGTMQTRTDLNIGISKMLFDDRLKVTIGSNFEIEGNARPGEQATNIAGDIAIDYQLSRDGRYLLRVYRKNQYQVTLQGQYVETGLGFIINMDYDDFNDLFKNSKEEADAFNTENRSFRSRFDRERMETDSVYRDSVRQVIRDSLGLDTTRFNRIPPRNDSTSKRSTAKLRAKPVLNSTPLLPNSNTPIPLLRREYWAYLTERRHGEA